jgi:hypothetical protein
MKEIIISILGKNHKHAIQFNEVYAYDEFYGLYTYKGNVRVIKSGMDFNFDDLEQGDKNKIVKMVESKKWKINKALQ